MTAHCDQLGAYVDAQLDAAEADAFELHLASCGACQLASHEALQLAALEAAARREPRRRPVRRVGRYAAMGAVAACAAIALAVLWRRPSEPAAPQLAFLTAPVRKTEARISYAAADRYRPYDVARAGEARPHDSIPLTALSELEHRGDLHGVAAALLLMNDPQRAAEYLDKAAPSHDVAADRALVQRATGQLAEALITLDGVLEIAPRHPQALWNRALVLRELGLPLSAAEAYRTIAGLNEPGWSEEAAANAKALADEMAERQAAFERLVNVDGPRLATAGDAVTPEVARRFPGMTRLRFYDAVRAARSPEAVRALAPLAATLDGIYGGAVLAGHLARIARADFRRRAPLAERYAQLVAGALDGAQTGALIDALRVAKQDDMLLGAILLANREGVPPALLPELRRIAEGLHDPWFHLLAVEQTSGALIRAGEHGAAEALLLPALASCAIDFRCTNLDLLLGDSYVTNFRLADTRRVIADGWIRAQRGAEWYLQQRLLQLRARLESVQDDVAGTTLPLVRAYARESVLRSPTRCDFAAWYREMLALTMVNRLDLVHAHGELAQVIGIDTTCPAHEPSIPAADTKARVLRDPALGSAAEVAALRDELAALGAMPTLEPGERAALALIEGRLLIDRDHPAAMALLERAIASARAAGSDDINARMARSYAYALLTLDAGGAGRWDRVWTLLGDDAGFVPSPRCALGVAVEDRASVVVIRDAAGTTRGSFNGERQGPTLDAATLVPTQLRDALRGCAAIEVVARPPVQGLPGLLPPDLAWSYRSSATQPAAAAPAHARRVVIAGAEPPAALGLPRLLPWRSSTTPDLALDGLAATPSRVLAELADASFVEIHAHGMVQASIADASFLMLSPEADGRYALTAGAIRRQPLRGHPVVILAACHAAATAKARHEAWSLPAAFVMAGARAVIASPDVISDAEAGGFFDDLRVRIEHGVAPAIALHDTRTSWLAAHPGADWTRSLMVFQ
jgi:cellulose synthase operon protein C